MFRSRSSLQPWVSRCSRRGGSTASASRYPRLDLVLGSTGLYTCLHRGSVVIVNDKRPQSATLNVVAESPVGLRDFGANTPCISLNCLGVTIQLKAAQSKPSGKPGHLRFATMIFSAFKRCNIIETLFRIVLI